MQKSQLDQRVMQHCSAYKFSQDTTSCIPAFRDTTDLYPYFPFDPPTQSDTNLIRNPIVQSSEWRHPSGKCEI